MYEVISNRNCRKFEVLLDYSEDNTHSAGVNLTGMPILGLLVPVMDAGTITFEISVDGSTWYALKNADGTTDSISISGGATPFFVSSDVLTPLAAYSGYLREPGSGALLRIKTSVAQTADRTFVFLGVA